MRRKTTAIHVWYLEMTSRPVPDNTIRPYEIRQCVEPLPELNRFLYATVGGPWKWYMRLDWSWQQWAGYLSQSNIETWVAYREGTPIGYFELDRQPDGNTEIAYFGLMPAFVGQGYGRMFLVDCIERAWGHNSKRIWLHTCSLDHPNALPNYLGRGFKVYREEDFTDSVPADPLQPWPDAGRPYDLD